MRPNRYRFDPMALIAGTVFAGIAIAYLLRASGTLTVRPEWTLATAAIGVGLAGLAGALWAMLPSRGPAPAAAMGRPASATTFAPTAPHPAGEAVVGSYPGGGAAGGDRPRAGAPGAGEDETRPGASSAAEDEPYAVAVVEAEDGVVADPVVEADDMVEPDRMVEAEARVVPGPVVEDERPKDPGPPTVDLTK
ncbi:hypothetical protein [Embleya sp. NPDC050493]|uniref:hypothetical protein n=1 Tax=Embleya sp. NPDC050493 TaxID=3363989 RepID=UPI0037980612